MNNSLKPKIRVHKSAYTDVRVLYRNDLKEALKKQAKQIVEKIEKEIQRLETEEDKNKDLWEDGRIDGSIKTLRWVLQEMKK